KDLSRADVAELRAAVTAMLKEGGAVPGQPFSDYAAFDGVTGYPNRHSCVLCWTPTSSLVQAALACPVLVLQDHQCGFHQTQAAQHDDNDKRQPDDGVYPIGGRVFDFDDQRTGADEEARDQDDEDGRAIAHIEHRVVEAARFAARRDVEIGAEQMALSAARTAAQQSGFRYAGLS